MTALDKEWWNIRFNEEILIGVCNFLNLFLTSRLLKDESIYLAVGGIALEVSPMNGSEN